MKSILTSFDIWFIAAAFIMLIMGLFQLGLFTRKAADKGLKKDWKALAQSLFRQRDILKRPGVGKSHLLVFFGFILPMLIIILVQLGLTIPLVPARLVSLVQEVAGVAMLLGTVYLLRRRLKIEGKAADLTDRFDAGAAGVKRVIFPVAVLLVVIVSGFLAESARISITHSSAAWASPVGWLVSLVTPASPLFMQVMIRIHFFCVLIFIATIPFTFMRHLVMSPVNILYKKTTPKAALREIDLDAGHTGAGTAADFSWKQMLETGACVSCGRCEENCPAFISGKPLSPRNVIAAILEQAEAIGRNPGAPAPLLEDTISGDEIWSCTTCMACVEHCPVCVEAMDKIVDMRRHQVLGKGALPAEARPMIRDLELFGDVFGSGAALRGDWAMHKDVPRVGKDRQTDVLFWVGCSGAFHPRNRETSLALVKILKAANVNFGILAEQEACCGDPARKLGDEALFRKLALQNIQAFENNGVKKIVTLCPHCLNTLKNDYTELGCRIPVVHATEFVMELIDSRKITPIYPADQKMAIHDPCYLGRYNGVYDPLRDVCRAVPQTQLEELDLTRDKGFCCGGGGGRMWLHENIGENINRVRAKAFADAKVDLIGTACPYCLVMLDDGVKSLEQEKTPRVADLIDIVADAI